jgi:hypothetical protein
MKIHVGQTWPHILHDFDRIQNPLDQELRRNAT